MSVMKKIDRLLIEEHGHIKLEELHVILIKSSSQQKQEDNNKAKKQYELYKYLNPRYFENAITHKEALIRLDSMKPRSNQSLIRFF